MERFGRPLLPFQRMRREVYKYEAQPPSDHIENLRRYLRIAPSLVPKNPVLSRFCIRHPDLQPSNIIVSRSSDSNLQVVGLIDWQHAPILPLFLLANIPDRIQNCDDPVSLSVTQPSPPDNLSDLDDTEQHNVKQLYRRRLVHYHYVKNTEEYNALHYTALTDHMGLLRRRLFTHAGDPWEGETLTLKVDLIEAAENWQALTGGGAPCPVVFDAKDVRETMELDKVLRRADGFQELLARIIGFGAEGWVLAERYEEAMARSKQMKEDALAAAETDEERAEIMTHWPLDDMDEEKYM